MEPDSSAVPYLCRAAPADYPLRLRRAGGGLLHQYRCYTGAVDTDAFPEQFTRHELKRKNTHTIRVC